jgi:hypothetical protein
MASYVTISIGSPLQVNAPIRLLLTSPLDAKALPPNTENANNKPLVKRTMR